MSNITITKGKVLKGDKVYVEFLKREGTESEPAECQETHKVPPHPDLTTAVSALTVHAILIGEFQNAAKLQKLEDIKQETLETFQAGFVVSEIETVLFTDRFKAESFEVNIHQKLSDYKYYPKTKFGGATECFKIETPFNLYG